MASPAARRRQRGHNARGRAIAAGERIEPVDQPAVWRGIQVTLRSCGYAEPRRVLAAPAFAADAAHAPPPSANGWRTRSAPGAGVQKPADGPTRTQSPTAAAVLIPLVNRLQGRVFRSAAPICPTIQVDQLPRPRRTGRCLAGPLRGSDRECWFPARR
jgi:hypothetical protein